MMSKYLWLSIILFAAGCSGQPKIETQLFLLTPDTQDSATESSQAEKQVIIVEPIKLANYLDQPGIVLQTGKNKIQVAHYHRWAEPLGQNIHRFILEVLSANSSDYTFLRHSKYSKQVSDLVLSIELNQFNGSSSGDVFVAGSWQLRKSKQDELILSDSFHYERTMPESGYSELVNQLAIILDELSKEILDSISK